MGLAGYAGSSELDDWFINVVGRRKPPQQLQDGYSHRKCLLDRVPMGQVLSRWTKHLLASQALNMAGSGLRSHEIGDAVCPGTSRMLR
jgi:hypothetical protein